MKQYLKKANCNNAEDGAFLYDKLTEEKFKEKITKEYEYVNGIYNGRIGLF